MVAAVVTCDPGWWLEPCLSALAAQDYPQLAVLVIDAGSTEDPTPRVAAVAPNAYVRRVRRRRGFAAAADEVLEAVEGATHFVLCHDDVALETDTVRLLVEEAFRSNAGIVAPKLVQWFSPDHLIAAGMGADGFGVAVPLLERGELDQGQHDVVRDVFYAPSACMLVRADLFTTLGGFDAGYPIVGEDLDLGWRAHLAGARVVSAPAARVRHLEATETGRRALDGSLLARAAEAPVLVAVGDAAVGAPRGAGPSPVAPAPSDGGDGDWWDLQRWDEEDDAAARGRGAPGDTAEWTAPRGGRRRARREQYDAGWAGDEEEWDVNRAEPRRRRSSPARPTGPTTPAGAPEADELDEDRALARLRAVAIAYAWPRALGRLAAMWLLSVLDAGRALVGQGGAAASRVMRPWTALVSQSGGLRKRRAAVRRSRAVSDRAVAAFQAGGVARLRAALRASSSRAEPLPDAPSRAAPLAALLALAVVAYGTRHLLVAHLPTVGELAPWPSLGAMVRAATSGWRTTGLGSSAAGPAAIGLLAVGGAAFLGHTTLLQHVLVLGMLPLGAVGAWRLARPFGSPRTRLVALVAYLVVPLPYNALATGHWNGLVSYAALPWLLGLLARSTGLRPFDAPEPAPRSGRPARPRLDLTRRVIAAAVLLGLAGAVEPALLPLAVIVALALALGIAVTGPARAGRPAVVVAAGGAVGAAVLLLPWSLGWLPPVGEWATFSAPAVTGRMAHLSTLLRFQTGPLGAGPLGYALLVVAAFPLVAGREWRAAWATRLWLVALTSFGLAWAGQHGALGIGWPPADVLLAPAAAAIALSAALGMAAFELDLPGYTFGWRQVASVVAAAAGVAACLPVLVASVNGRWNQPTTGYDAVFPWMAAKRADGDFRVLWVGAPSSLPVAGWRLDGHTAYATSLDGPPDLLDQWPGTSRGPTRLLGQALTLTRRGLTTEVGHLLAPMAVRYIVVVNRQSPAATTSAHDEPAPADIATGLDSQLDLQAVDRADAYTVYQNDAWAPMRVQLPDGAVGPAQLDDPRVARAVDLRAGTNVLPVTSGPTTARGTLGPSAEVEVAQAPSSHWQLRVGGSDAGRQPAFGAANLFSTGPGGPATLSYATPVGWRLAVLVEAVLWVLALAALAVARRRPRPPDDQPPAAAPAPPVLVGMRASGAGEAAFAGVSGPVGVPAGEADPVEGGDPAGVGHPVGVVDAVGATDAVATGDHAADHSATNGSGRPGADESDDPGADGVDPSAAYGSGPQGPDGADPSGADGFGDPSGGGMPGGPA